MKKKIITKEEFIQINKDAADKMFSDKKLQKKALEVFVEADEQRWVHQSSWMGEPLLNLPQDMFAIQNIIFETKPDYIIEVGVAWGGGLLFEATLLEILGGSKVIGVDIFIPNDLRERLKGHKKLSKRIELIEGSSTSDETVDKIKKIVGNSKKIMVVLDSYHTHEHVLKELEIYSQFIGKGFFIVCADTIVEHIPEQKHRPRQWGHGNNPATAVKEFTDNEKRFEVDRDIDKKLLFSCNPGGYLKAIN